jgi:hypothetical protein
MPRSRRQDSNPQSPFYDKGAQPLGDDGKLRSHRQESNPHKTPYKGVAQPLGDSGKRGERPLFWPNLSIPVCERPIRPVR